MPGTLSRKRFWLKKETLYFDFCEILRASFYRNRAILSFEGVFTKRKHGSTHIAFWEKFWPKDNTVQPILSFKKIFTKRQYDSIHIVFQENFHQKTIRFKPYCLLKKIDELIIRFNPYSLLGKFWWKDKTV